MMLWMLATLLLSTLLAICAAVGDRIAAQFAVPRRFIWIAALLASFAVPVFTGLKSAAPVPLVVAQTADDGAPLKPMAVWPRIVPSGLAAMDVSRAPEWQTWGARVAATVERADRWVLAAWLVASLALLTGLVVRLAMLRRARRGWTVTNELGTPVFVAPSAGPAAVGVLRPRVVIPAWLLDADHQTRVLLLRHETEHVRAGDTRVLFGAMVLEALVPWNAAVLWMVRRLRLAVEIDCDRRVFSNVGGARRYGFALLAAAERHAAPLSIGVGLQDAPSQIEARIHAVTQHRSPRPLRATVALGVLAGIVAIVSSWMPRPSLRSAEAQPIVRQDSAGVRAVRDFIAAYNDPDTTRIVMFVAVAMNHDTSSLRSLSQADRGDLLSPPASFIRARRQFGALVLQRVVAKSDRHAEYVAIEQSTRRQLVGYIMASERNPAWIERFSLVYVPSGTSLDDPDVQRQFYPSGALLQALLRRQPALPSGPP